MKHLVDALRSFNAKERFWLIASATGNPGLSDDFRGDLRKVVDVAVSSDAWWAMDYHLDWLEAALLSLNARQGTIFSAPEPGRNLNRNQQDIDLIVAWDVDDLTDLLLIEAKGVTSWVNDQHKAKLDRLVGLFGVDGQGYPEVRPAFLLASPSAPQRLDYSGTPSWAVEKDGRAKWVQLQVPSNLRRPERCDEEGQPLTTGTFWRVVPRKVPGADGSV